MAHSPQSITQAGAKFERIVAIKQSRPGQPTRRPVGRLSELVLIPQSTCRLDGVASFRFHLFRHAKLCSSRSKRAHQAGWRAKKAVRKAIKDTKVSWRCFSLGCCAHSPRSRRHCADHHLVDQNAVRTEKQGAGQPPRRLGRHADQRAVAVGHRATRAEEPEAAESIRIVRPPPLEAEDIRDHVI